MDIKMTADAKIKGDETLSFKDFEMVYIGNGPYYMRWRNDDVEICLEPCLNGCDVAVYDRKNKMNLLEPKYCTNLVEDDYSTHEAFNKEFRKRAIGKADEFYKKYAKETI